MTTRLNPGDTAPDFTLPAVIGPGGAEAPVPWTLSAQRGGRLILYVYPAAGTPGCTVEAHDFQAALPDFAAAGLAVVGLSPDGPAKLGRFAQAQGLTFPLLSDPEHVAMTALGAWGEKKQYGRTVTGTIRSTFVIAADGAIESAQYSVRAAGHVARLRRDLGL
ncbi:MAG: peroxiredoxin [Bifidobacteriaceae bacterium]|jgi:peroxiredoxin Q/BCP|nr:peroxiredoxin [Bifidobacteriaceae bacterium]